MSGPPWRIRLSRPLVDEPTIRPTGHIFVGSKAPWYEIPDDLPQHAEYPPGV